MPEEPRKRRKAPARTLEGREQELINLAYDEAEKRILSGKANTTLLLHFIKQGSRRNRIEEESLYGKIELDKAKISQIDTEKHIVELYEDAIAAMTRYRRGVDDEIVQ